MLLAPLEISFLCSPLFVFTAEPLGRENVGKQDERNGAASFERLQTKVVSSFSVLEDGRRRASFERLLYTCAQCSFFGPIWKYLSHADEASYYQHSVIIQLGKLYRCVSEILKRKVCFNCFISEARVTGRLC